MVVAILLALATVSGDLPLPGRTPVGWVRHGPPAAIDGVGSYTFATPRSIVGGATPGIDSYPADYKGPGLAISMDFGRYGGPPCQQGDRCSTLSVVGGIAARSLFTPDEEHSGSKGIRYYFPIAQDKSGEVSGMGRASLVVWGYCATDTACDLFDRIMATMTLLPAKR